MALDAVLERAGGLVCLSGCATHGVLAAPLVRGDRGLAEDRAARLREAFGERLWVELTRPFLRGDRARVRALVELARRRGLPLVATNDVHVHARRRGPLQDALVAIRTHATLDACEAARRGNREHVLKPPAEMAALFADLPQAVRATVEIAERCRFDLTRDLGYRPPQTAAEPDRALAELTRTRFAERYPGTSPHRREAASRLEEELELIAHHRLSGFFLLHFEVLELAREVALEVRGVGRARATCCRRGAGAARASAPSSATSRASRTSTPWRGASRSAASSTRSSRASPTSTSTSRATSGSG